MSLADVRVYCSHCLSPASASFYRIEEDTKRYAPTLRSRPLDKHDRLPPRCCKPSRSLPFAPLALHDRRSRQRLELLADFQVDGGNPRIAVHRPERMRGGDADGLGFAGELEVVYLTRGMAEGTRYETPLPAPRPSVGRVRWPRRERSPARSMPREIPKKNPPPTLALCVSIQSTERISRMSARSPLGLSITSTISRERDRALVERPAPPDCPGRRA